MSGKYDFLDVSVAAEAEVLRQLQANSLRLLGKLRALHDRRAAGENAVEGRATCSDRLFAQAAAMRDVESLVSRLYDASSATGAVFRKVPE